MKFAIFLLADTDSNEALGRMVNALEATKQFKEAGDEVKLFFDGTGPKWISELNKKDHIAHELFNSISDKIEGACLFCAKAFGAKDSVSQCKIDLIDQKDDHIDVRKLASDGFSILNF
jgi:hypothetical protein